MPAEYKSSIGLQILIPVLITLVGVSALMAYHRIWPGLALMIITTAFVLYVLLSVRYVIEDGMLKISCGILYKMSVAIDKIQTLRETRNPISAPAASLDRLEITFNKYDYIIVSPQNKQAFIEHLMALNPDIKMLERKRREK